MKNKGIYIAYDKNDNPYYRVAVTLNGHHVSLGNFKSESDSLKCYEEYIRIVSDNDISAEQYDKEMKLSFEKFILLINYRDNHVYFPKPIYLKKNFFLYYLEPGFVLKFDKDDLFFYINHKILKRGNRLYYNDFGIQTTLKEKYNIPVYGVLNRDYRFINNDCFDFRYSNIEILNKFHGIEKTSKNNKISYKVKINLKGYHYVGTYPTELEACIAYNKAADIIKQNHNINYKQNDPEISAKQYADIYSKLKISPKINLI